MAVLAENHYGKSRVRLVKVLRGADRHDIYEWNVGIYLTGDFDACYLDGNNAGVMATDTMKNTVYATARGSSATTPEQFALELAQNFATRKRSLTQVRVTVEENMWQRLKVDGGKHPSAFLQRGPDVATASVILAQGNEPSITSGVKGLVILKTANSGFSGFEQDELTTLPETDDRLLGTEATIEWLYAAMPANPATLREGVMQTLLSTFACHKSLSVQHTLYAMADAALAKHPELVELALTMPNRHNILADMARLGRDNPNTIFVPTDEPHGYIHARVTR